MYIVKRIVYKEVNQNKFQRFLIDLGHVLKNYQKVEYGYKNCFDLKDIFVSRVNTIKPLNLRRLTMYRIISV